MVSGTPILVYGSPSTAQVRYAQEAGWAHVVAARDPGHLREGMRAIMENDALRRRVSRAAQGTAACNHDAATVRVAFQAVLAGAAMAPVA